MSIQPRFNVGAKVRGREGSDIWSEGTVSSIETLDDGEHVYSVREVQPESSYFTAAESELEPDDSGWFDLDDLEQVKAELRSTVASTSRYCSMDASDRRYRLREYARISFLASRLAWLEASEAEIEELHTARASRTGNEKPGSSA